MSGAGNAPALGRHSARVARLRRIVRREEKDLTVVDGAKLAAELARAGVPIVELYGDAEALAAAAAEPGLRRVEEAGRAYLLDASTLAHVAPTRQPQGLLAVVACPAVDLRCEGIAIYLDRVQDPGNVGAVIRCAAALGADGVACSPGCADPFSPRAVRASAGHALRLAVQPDARFEPLAAGFRRATGTVAGLAGAAALTLARWRPRLPLLLALGNEGQGLAPEVAAGCEQIVGIPLGGEVESLNVAVAAGVVLASLAGLAGAPILDSDGKRGRHR